MTDGQSLTDDTTELYTFSNDKDGDDNENGNQVSLMTKTYTGRSQVESNPKTSVDKVEDPTVKSVVQFIEIQPSENISEVNADAGPKMIQTMTIPFPTTIGKMNASETCGLKRQMQMTEMDVNDISHMKKTRRSTFGAQPEEKELSTEPSQRDLEVNVLKKPLSMSSNVDDRIDFTINNEFMKKRKYDQVAKKRNENSMTDRAFEENPREDRRERMKNQKKVNLALFVSKAEYLAQIAEMKKITGEKHIQTDEAEALETAQKALTCYNAIKVIFEEENKSHPQEEDTEMEDFREDGIEMKVIEEAEKQFE